MARATQENLTYAQLEQALGVKVADDLFRLFAVDLAAPEEQEIKDAPLLSPQVLLTLNRKKAL